MKTNSFVGEILGFLVIVFACLCLGRLCTGQGIKPVLESVWYGNRDGGQP